MSEKNYRRKLFFKKHPYCCYCGGGVPATTVDHNPARALFLNRQWPDGYEFPACLDCNNMASSHEALFALLCQLGGTHKKPHGNHANDLKKHFMGAARRFPEAMQNLAVPITANHARSIDMETGLSRLPGQTYGGSALFTLDHPEFRVALDAGFAKLAMALFYKHAGRILPPHGVVAFQHFTNTQYAAARHFYDHIRLNLVKEESPVHHRTSGLQDQFSYRWFKHSDGQFLCFWIQIHNTFSIIALAGDTPMDWSQLHESFRRQSPNLPIKANTPDR